MTTVILSGTGKTGRRVVLRMNARDLPVRVGSRVGKPPFNWGDESTWAPVLRGATAAYVAYYPDLAIPGAVEKIRRLTDVAADSGLQRLVLLSGRGEDEAERAEQVVQRSGLEWTIVRASWLNQNFSEGFMQESVASGEVALPAGQVPEPFVDANDIADVAVAALTEGRHVGKLYELTGPRPLTFAEAVQEMAKAASRDIRYVRLSREEFAAGLAEYQIPDDFAWLLDYLFSTVLDGRNAQVADGVRRALGREPTDFADYAQKAAATGGWADRSTSEIAERQA